MNTPSPAYSTVGCAAIAIVLGGLLATTAGLTLTYDAPTIQPGTVDQQANGTTYVSTQGFHFEGYGSVNKPSRVVALSSDASRENIHRGDAGGRNWFYNVDPLPNSNLLVVYTLPTSTLVYERNPDTGERIWQQRLNLTSSRA